MTFGPCWLSRSSYSLLPTSFELEWKIGVSLRQIRTHTMAVYSGLKETKQALNSLCFSLNISHAAMIENSKSLTEETFWVAQYLTIISNISTEWEEIFGRLITLANYIFASYLPIHAHFITLAKFPCRNPCVDCLSRPTTQKFDQLSVKVYHTLTTILTTTRTNLHPVFLASSLCPSLLLVRLLPCSLKIKPGNSWEKGY